MQLIMLTDRIIRQVGKDIREVPSLLGVSEGFQCSEQNPVSSSVSSTKRESPT